MWRQGFETRTGPYGPTGKTSNRSVLRSVQGEELFYTKKAGTRTDRGPTVRFCEP